MFADILSKLAYLCCQIFRIGGSAPKLLLRHHCMHSYHLNEAEIFWRRECLVIFVLQHLGHIHSHLDKRIATSQKHFCDLESLESLVTKHKKTNSCFDLKFLFLTQNKIPYPHGGLHVNC